MNPKQLGKFGEKIAIDHLKRKGYQILDRNYSGRLVSGLSRGEIDIIARKEDTISFVEVKTLAHLGRAGPSFLPEQKVNFQKQRKIIKTAKNWLREKKIPLDSKWQIDVIAIDLNLANKKAKIRHLKNVVSG